MADVSGFLNLMTEANIESNSASLEVLIENIKSKSKYLNIDASYYQNLPMIKNKNDFEKWVAFGYLLEDKLNSEKNQKYDVSKSLTFDYLRMAKILKYKPLSNRAVELAKMHAKSAK